MALRSIRVKAAFNAFYDDRFDYARKKNTSNEIENIKPGAKTVYIRSSHLAYLQNRLEADGTQFMSQMTIAQVRAAYDEAVGSIKGRRGQKPAVNTVRTYVDSFKGFIKFCVSMSYIDASQGYLMTKNLPVSVALNNRMLYVPPEKWQVAFQAARERHPTDLAVVAVAYYLALRGSEVALLRRKDINRQDRRVRIRRQKTVDVLPLTAPEALIDILDELDKWLIDNGYELNDENPLIPARIHNAYVSGHVGGGRGRKVSPAWPVAIDKPVGATPANGMVKRALKTAGYTEDEMYGQALHIARRSRAVALFKADWDIRLISEMLGHADIKVTLNYIRHGVEKEDLAEMLNAPLVTPPPPTLAIESVHSDISIRDMPAVPQTVVDALKALSSMVDGGIMDREEARAMMERIIR